MPGKYFRTEGVTTSDRWPDRRITGGWE